MLYLRVNDSRYPDKLVKRGEVKDVKWYMFLVQNVKPGNDKRGLEPFRKDGNSLNHRTAQNIMFVRMEETPSAPVPMQFCHLTREYDVRFFTGLTSTGTFKTLYDHVSAKASVMSYWEGPKRTSHGSP